MSFLSEIVFLDVVILHPFSECQVFPSRSAGSGAELGGVVASLSSTPAMEVPRIGGSN